MLNSDFSLLVTRGGGGGGGGDSNGPIILNLCSSILAILFSILLSEI